MLKQYLELMDCTYTFQKKIRRIVLKQNFFFFYFFDSCNPFAYKHLLHKYVYDSVENVH